MSRFDRLAEEYRRRVMRTPVTRANRKIEPAIQLAGGISLALSINL